MSVERHSEWTARLLVRRELMKLPLEARKFLALKYPHMGPYEAYIWDEFLRKTKLKFIRIDYDVRVGVPNVPDWLIEKLRKLEQQLKQGDESVRREYEVVKATYESFSALTKLRIDAVGETENEVWIFEVKPRAGRTALGQLLAYVDWYRRDFRPTKPLRAACVCIAVDPSLKPVFDRYGIQIFNVREM